MISTIQKMFLGNSPIWYKNTIVVFLIINPIALSIFNTIGMNGNFIVGWFFLLQFIFTLALALKCYPLQPGGLLAIQAVILGLTTTEAIFHEIENNLEVILLLVFMVAGIFFMKNLMLTIFTKLLLRVKSKIYLSLLLFIALYLNGLKQVWAYLILIFNFILLPPLLSFILFFCFHHSIRHYIHSIYHESLVPKKYTINQYLKNIVLASVLFTVLMLIFLRVYGDHSFDIIIVKYVFILLACLTLPHLILNIYYDIRKN